MTKVEEKEVKDLYSLASGSSFSFLVTQCGSVTRFGQLLEEVLVLYVICHCHSSWLLNRESIHLGP
jgi:hypothetical protein